MHVFQTFACGVQILAPSLTMTQQKTTFNREAYTWLLVCFVICLTLWMNTRLWSLTIWYPFNFLQNKTFFGFYINWITVKMFFLTGVSTYVYSPLPVQAQRRSREQSRSASALSVSAGDEKSEHSEAADQHLSYYSNGGLFTTTTTGNWRGGRGKPDSQLDYNSWPSIHPR